VYKWLVQSKTPSRVTQKRDCMYLYHYDDLLPVEENEGLGIFDGVPISQPLLKAFPMANNTA
jgi:hypothetical protein